MVTGRAGCLTAESGVLCRNYGALRLVVREDPWMFKAILLDFYGTVVHEDDVLISELCSTINASSPQQPGASAIGSHWWKVFSELFHDSHGETFRTQRDLERRAFNETCTHFNASCDADPLLAQLFDAWQNPELFQDAQQFFAKVEVPIVVLSNIDRPDIEAAIEKHKLPLTSIITSEDVRSYKPRPELFLAGLDALRLPPEEVLHVGDSATSDVIGANQLGIAVAWINRLGKALTVTAKPDYTITTLPELLPILGGS